MLNVVTMSVIMLIETIKLILLAECHYAKWHNIVLSLIKLNLSIVLSVIMLSDTIKLIVLSAIILRVIMLSDTI